MVVFCLGAAHLEGSQAQSQASRPGSDSGRKTGKGANRSHRAPPQASPHQGQNGLSPGLPQSWADPSQVLGRVPHRWASTEKAWVCPTSSTEPAASSGGTACMPRLFQNFQGPCTPPETLCPGSGHSLACLHQAWPRFSLQPRPHANTQGSRNLDPGWDQGPAVGAAPRPRSFGHMGITTAASVGGTAVTVITSHCHPCPSTRTLQSP